MKGVTFGSLGPLLPFSKTPPPKLIKNGNFHKLYFLLFSFVTLSLTAKNYVSITNIVNFGPLGPFCSFQKSTPLNSSKTEIFKNDIFFCCFGPLLPFKGPRTHQKRKFSKITISSVLLYHTEHTYQKLCFYHRNCDF